MPPFVETVGLLRKEKRLRHRNDSEDEEVLKRKKLKRADVKKNKPVKRTIIFSFVILYEKREINSLSEEQDAQNLDNGCLKGTQCSACNKVIVNKTKLLDEEFSTGTIFNRKYLLFAYDNRKSTKKEPYSFCMCQQSFVNVNSKGDNDDAHNQRACGSSRKK